MRAHLEVVLLASVACGLAFETACIEEPDYEGRRCFAQDPCPSGYVCDLDDRCHRNGPDAGIADAGAFDGGTLDPGSCADPMTFPPVGWEARHFYLTRDLGLESQNCFAVERIDTNQLERDFSFDGPTPDVVSLFGSRYTARRVLGLGRLRFTVSHDDGLRVLIDDALIYEHWEGPTDRDHFADSAYLPRAEYRLTVEHNDTAGVARLAVHWRSACAMEGDPSGIAWSLTYYRLDASSAIDRNDCFGAELAGTSSIGFDWGVGAPQPVLEAGVSDRFAVVGRTRRTFGGMTRFEITHDDGMRLFDGTTLIYDAWAPGPLRSATRDVVLAGEHELTFELGDFDGNASVSLSW